MKRLINFFVVLSIIIIPAGHLRADELPMPKADFSADIIMEVQETGEKPMTITGKINSTKDKARMVLEIMGRKNITITRRDLGVQWVLIPEQKMYMENKIGTNKEKDPNSKATFEENVKITNIGKEVVNGVQTTKNKVTSTDSDGEKTVGFLWLSKENIPVKMEGASRSNGKTSKFKREYRNLKIGKQSKDLFEIPPGLNKFSNPFMGGMPPFGKAQGPKGGEGVSGEQLRKMQEEMKKQMEEFKKRYGK